jgi:hypothetical protein
VTFIFEPDPPSIAALFGDITRAREEVPADDLVAAGHTFGRRSAANPTGKCLVCPGEHGSAGPCDHERYSRTMIGFTMAHLEELVTAHLNPDKRTSRAIRMRLQHEYETLPPRHVCSCPGRGRDNNMTGCPSENVSLGYPPCPTCRKLHANDQWILVDVGAEIGHTTAVYAPMPDTLLLDLAAGNWRARARAS